ASCSIPIGVKPLLMAACRVVPLPANGSNTTPPGGTIKDTNHSINASGLTVLCWIFVPSSRLITGRSFLGALAWYLNTGKNRDAPPESLCAENSPPLLKPVADSGLPLAPLLAPPLLSTPLCSSISAAACSSSNTLAGKRPAEGS